MSNLAYGTFTITNLSTVTSVDVYYYNSTSSTSLSGGSWSTNTPTWTNGKYIWSKTVTTWEQGVTTESKPVCITGQKGSTGAAGQSVTKITQQYALGTNSTTAPTSGWSTAMPAFESGKFYWTRSEIVWTNPSSTTYTTAVLANGLTSANTNAETAKTDAASAVSTANTANQTANTANQTANTANQTAQNAVSIANGKNTIYYSSSKPTGGTYKAGDTWFNLTTDGYRLYEYDATAKDWVQKSMDGKSITAGTVTAAQIHAGAITTDKLATNAIKSVNYAAGTAPYSLTGTFLDLSNGNIFTPNFGVNNDSTDNIDNGAYIKGTIQAYDGKIGSDNNNYWYIGNYFDYNQGQSAMIRSHGTAAIQLGDSSTWRLSTNRIHTAWNDDSTSGEAFRLHYPTYGGKYWDSGLHVPASATDKLLYIRNAATTVSLENLQNDINDNSGGNYWNYQFYLTNDGSLYAKNIYIMDDNGGTIQIGGTDGVYLLKSGGTISGNLEITGTLKMQGNFLNKSGSAITLQTNLASTSAITLTGNSTSPIKLGVTGTLPVANGGTGNTNYTSGGIVYVSNTSPKTLLSNAAGTSGQLLASGGSGVPTWVNASSLTVAAATKATQDGNGKVIATTYLPLTGGNVTGPVNFGDSVSIDDLTAGTLVVTGNSNFINGINTTHINGGQAIYPVKGTQTASTGSWIGNINISALYDGLTIAYWLPYAPSGNATLNLTLNNGTTTGAINCYYSGTSRLTTHYGAGNTILLTYWSNANINGSSYTGWWAHSQYYSNDIVQQGINYAQFQADTGGIQNYSLFLRTVNDKYASIVTSAGTGTKTKSTLAFDLSRLYLYYCNNAIAVDGYTSTWYVKTSYPLADMRYSFNITSNAGLVGKKPVYLVFNATQTGNGYHTLADNWWVQDLPTSADNKLYMYLGMAYDWYRMDLELNHPIYYFENGSIQTYYDGYFAGRLSSSQITTALGFTPYNATNPNGYTSNKGTVTSVAASGSGGISISGSPITTTGTIGIGLNLSTAINGLGEGASPATRNDYIVAQYAGGGTTTTTYHRRKLSNIFAALAAEDIPSLPWSKISSGNDDLKAIEALTGTSGFLKKTAANTWTLDTNTYLTGITSSQVTTALGYTPYNATNPNGYTTNTGTVTKVTAGSGLKINTNTSGGDITTTGTINHINSVTAQTTQGLYPIKIDAQGHISAYGSAVTTWALSNITGADDLKAIEALSGTSGLLKKTAANTWSLDTTSYVPTTRKVNGHALSSDVTVTKSDVGLGNVTNYQQITGIGQGANGTLRVWTGDPTSTSTDDYTDVTITITAYDQSTVKKAVALDLSAAVGSTSKPVYFKADGKPYEIGYTIEKSVPSNAIFTDTTYSFADSYDASSNKGATVATVTNAINNLDVSAITGTTGQTITSISEINGKINATYNNISITKSQISDFPSSMTPTAHTHAYIVTEGDNRSVATTPNDYTSTNGRPNRIVFRGLKGNSHINSPSSDTYSYLVGLRGWSDDSGGNAHEIAFNNTGIFVRKGATTTWGNWERLYTSGNLTKTVITNLGIPAQDTTYTFDGTYNASTNKAATVSTVTNAINALDGGTIGAGGKGKTITSLSQSNGNVSATFEDISITKSQISDFPTSMTPTAHTHDDRYYTESEIDNKFTALTNTTTQINNIKFYSGTCSAGKTYIGWIKIASVTMSSNNYIGENGYDIGIYRNYNSPAAESYNIKVNTGWGNASIVQLNGKAGTQIIEKFRLVKDNTNHIWYFEIYVNPTYSTHENLVNFRIQSWNNVELNLLNTVQTEADSDLQIVSTIDLKPQGVVSNSNFYGNLVGTADIANSANSVAWSNITSKPINFITNVGALNTNGWKTLGGRTTQSSIAISYATSSGAIWNSGAFSSSIVFGCQDTKGMVDVGYTSPVVTFGGGSVNGSTDDAPKWYFKLNGTSGQSYTFPATSKTLAATDGSNASGSWGISITGNAATATSATTASAIGTSTIWLYAHNSNEINFGGTNTATTIFMGYRATDSRPIPTKFVFGSSSGTADLQAKTVYLGSGTTSYITGTQYTGNAATATKATQDKNGNDITTKYVTIDTAQTITGRKTFSDLAAVTFKPSSGMDKCNINYDASLGALVFSF